MQKNKRKSGRNIEIPQQLPLSVFFVFTVHSAAWESSTGNPKVVEALSFSYRQM
jgi:hypothetical protein